MAVIKPKTRKKLSKLLARLVKRHGAEMALALVTGIISSLAAARADKAPKKVKRAKAERLEKQARPVKSARPLVTRKRAAM
jgi:hypothetical protein